MYIIFFVGKHPILGFENEKRLVTHIQKLEKAGFPADRQLIRRLAYQFAEKLNIKHNFNAETEMAGSQWLQSFLERNPVLSVRQAEGLSVARAMGLNREEVDKMFNLLTEVLSEHGLLYQPERIYNMDETGVQMNNKTGKVIATKGAKSVSSITSAEKGETLSVIACCNAIGNFLPPVVIIKGVNQKPEFSEGLPTGSRVFMNKKSAYVNSELFYKWLVEHFIPQKPQGKVLLILDGHTSHSSAFNMLETAERNDVILFCLPSHTTQALQPLDRSFFKPFKTFFTTETNNYMRSHPQKKITRYQSGKLIGNAWIRAATPANALSGFKACGIYPLNPNIIPEQYFDISDLHASENVTDEPVASTSIQACNTLISSNGSAKDQNECIQIDIDAVVLPTNSPGPEYSDKILAVPVTNVQPSTSNKGSGDKTITPSKILHESSPIPKIPKIQFKKVKQSAAILNSIENIKKKKENTKATKNIQVRTETIKKSVAKKKKITRKRMRIDSSSSNDSKETCDRENIADTNYSCVECLDDYDTTNSSDDWIQCVMCRDWLHESCSMYGDYCNKCGRIRLLASKEKKK